MNEPRLQVMLLDYPVTIWSTSRQWLEEVRRELSLAGLSGDPAAGRLSREVSELVSRHGVALGGDGDGGNATLWAAHEHGLDRVDVGYEVSHDITVTAPGMAELIDRLDRRCRDGLLLTLPPKRAEKALIDWISTQAVGQFEGDSPQAWAGPWVIA